MTKKSRDRRKMVRRWLRTGLITATHKPDGRLIMPFNQLKVKVFNQFKFRKVSSEELKALRNPAYEYLIP